MPWERMTAARKPCPCGAGQVHVDITYKDSHWGMTDQTWEGVIECDHCAPLYGFIGSGRGVDLIRVQDKERRDKLLRQAFDCENACMRSDEVAAVIEKLAAELDALPTMAASIASRSSLASKPPRCQPSGSTFAMFLRASGCHPLFAKGMRRRVAFTAFARCLSILA
jgi:hypothetical protein